jgi:hypothetical protein
MTSASWSTMLVVAVNTIVFHAMPRFSRPDILFAVTVPEAFAAGAGRTLVARYRAIVWSGATAALAIGLLLPTILPDSGWAGWLVMGAVAGNMIVALAAWLLAHRRARAHAVPPSHVRVASLVPRDTSLPGGTLFAVGPFAILLATALLVYTYGDDAPAGQRTITSFLALGGVYVVMTLIMAVSMARRSRQIAIDGPAAAAEQRFRRVNVLVLVLVAYAVAIQMSAATVASAAAHAVQFRRCHLDVPRRPGRSTHGRACGAAGGARRRHARRRVESRRPVLFQPARPGHLGRESYWPRLRPEHGQPARMAAHRRHDAGADDCCPSVVLGARLC